MRVLSFDIGIKNLAWCLMDTSTKEVIDWCNYNILEDISGTITEFNKCQCGAKASWEHMRGEDIRYTCKRHLPIDRPAYESPSKSAVDLKALLKSKYADTKGKKDVLRERALGLVSLPASTKLTKTSSVSLIDLYDGIRKCVSQRALSMLSASRILLENQPAYKNPTMKSVQSFLFGVLREASHKNNKFPTIELVHASKKVSYTKKGDAGYSERKGNSEDKVLATLNDVKWRQFFLESKKKSDLADAYCMCIESISA